MTQHSSQDARDRTIIVLGYNLTPSGELTPTLRSRVMRAVQLHHSGHTGKIVMSGGQDQQEPCTSAAAMRLYAISSGIPTSDILIQGDGLDTVGEGIFCRLFLTPPLLTKGILIVTSEFHASRAVKIFRFIFGQAYDIEVDPIVDDSLESSELAAKEANSLCAFENLFEGIEAGDIRPIVERFWRGHRLYSGAKFVTLREKTMMLAAQSN